ncbi:hypothetical protein [Mycoplasma sp. ATU-Cv-703]|uniref:hypothetical protein n=1 Tax=Mycoplasma sp. ATU-Cv-703 TaxID=2498595 RepID=UPI000FDE408D
MNKPGLSSALIKVLGQIFLKTGWAIILVCAIWIFISLCLSGDWKWFYLTLLVPSLIFLFSLIYRVINYCLYKNWSKQSLKIYDLNKEELNTKIKEDVKVIFKEKAVHIFEQFGGGKTHYAQKLIGTYVCWKYGTIILYFNMWWVKRKSAFVKNLFGNKQSFSLGPKSCGLSFIKEDNDSYFNYFLAFLLTLLEYVFLFIWVILGWFWNWGFWKYRKLILIDDPDRNPSHQQLAPMVNELMFRNDVYLILHSNFINNLDKIVRERIFLPTTMFKNVNLRHFKEADSYLNEIMPPKLKNEELKSKMRKAYSLYLTIKTENDFHIDRLRNLLECMGKNLEDFKIKTEKENNSAYYFFVPPNANVFGDIKILYKGDLITDFDINKIVEVLGLNILPADVYSLQKFNKYLEEIQHNQGLGYRYLTSELQRHELLWWCFGHIIENYFKNHHVKTCLMRYKDFAKEDILKMIKAIEPLTDMNPDLPKLVDLFVHFKNLVVDVKETLVSEKYFKQMSFAKKIIETLEPKLEKNVLKFVKKFKREFGDSCTAYFISYIYSELFIYEKKLPMQFQRIADSINLKGIVQDYYYFLEYIRKTEPWYGDITAKLVNQVNNWSIEDQYRIVARISEKILNCGSESDRRNMKNFIINLLSKLKINTPNDKSVKKMYMVEFLLNLKKRINRPGGEEVDLISILREYFPQKTVWAYQNWLKVTK